MNCEERKIKTLHDLKHCWIKTDLRKSDGGAIHISKLLTTKPMTYGRMVWKMPATAFWDSFHMSKEAGMYLMGEKSGRYIEGFW